MTHYMDLPFGEGEVIKNYKEMCARLGEKERSGKSRTIQLERWENYFQWVKKGHKFIITDILSDSFPTDDNNHTKEVGKEYNATLEKLILNTLHWIGEKKEDYKTYLTVTSMVNLTKIINPNFMPAYREEGSISYKKIAKEIDESSDFVEVFMSRVYGTLYYDFKAVLERLSRRRLVYYEKVLMVKPTTIFAHEEVDFDDKQLLGVGHNEKTLTEMKKYYNTLETVISGLEDRQTYYEKKRELTAVRPALEFEKTVVVHVENLVLEAMGLEDIRGVFAKKLQKEYYRAVSKLLNKAIGVDYAYQSYAVYFSPIIMKRLHIENEELFKIADGQRAELELLLNQQFSNNLEQNFKRFHEKAKLKATINQKNVIPKQEQANSLQQSQAEELSSNEKAVISVKHLDTSLGTLMNSYVTLYGR